MLSSREIQLSLPDELVALILDELAANSYAKEANSDLYHCAMVCRVWEDIALSLLYRRLRLVGVSVAVLEKLARSDALKRYRTDSLELDSPESRGSSDPSDALSRMLTSCEGLRELALVHPSTQILLDVGEELFWHPSLSNLESLTLCYSLHLSDFGRTGGPPFRLRKLTTDLRNTHLSILRRIVDVSAEPTTLLTSLDIRLVGGQRYIETNLRVLQPLAPTLHSLYLPPLPLDRMLNPSFSAFRVAISKFLDKATCLTFLSISMDRVPVNDFPLRAPFLTFILGQVKSQLQTLVLSIPPSELSTLVLQTIVKETDVETFSNLRQIQFVKTRWMELERIGGWSEVLTELENRRIKVVARDSM